MNIKTLSVSLTALCLSAAAPAADMLLENYGSSRPTWLSKLKKLDRSSDGKFRILQIGDSHTAGDLFTEQLRLRLQQKWGDGGIGWVYPSTVKGQRSAAVRYDGSWQTVSSRSVSDDFPLGGIIAKANGSSVTISAKDGSSGERQISVFAKPVLPEQTLSFNGREVPAGSSGWQIIRSNGRLPLTLSSSMPWDIGYINIENPGRGVTVSALGINGAQLTHWSKWRPSWQDDLTQTRADLVIIAYGTNEAFARDLDITATEQSWRSYIRQIKQSLPDAGILILSAPESLKSTSGSCGTRPATLSSIQQMQQRVAREEKIMYWSWQNAMGGECSMKSWMSQGLAAKDGVHFSGKGYRQAADHLADSLIQMAD